jgi:hypothetical protein
MRQLAYDELVKVADKVRRRGVWERCIKVIEELYETENIVGFDANADDSYNDEDYDQDGELTVFGEDGDPLPYDFTKPFFRQFVITDEEMKNYQRDLDDWSLPHQVREALEAMVGAALGVDLEATGESAEMEHFKHRFYYLVAPKVPEVFVND